MDAGSPMSSVMFNGDSIVVVSYSWDRYWREPYYYEDDMVEGDGKAVSGTDDQDMGEGSSSDESSDYVPEEWTEIVFVDLEEGMFSDVSRLKLDRYAHISLMTEEFLILDHGSAHSAFSLEGGDGMEELGTWYGNGWVRGGDLTEERLVLALGMWGVDIRNI
jgi:hypothetical protein